MTEEKTWTQEDINQMLETNDAAVERAVLRIHDNIDFLRPRFDLGATAWQTENILKNFAQFLRGQDDKGNQRWQPKSLTHRIANRQLKKLCYPNKNVIQTARSIVKRFAVYLTNVANNHYEKEKIAVDGITDWPDHIFLGGPRQRRYGDRYEYEMVLKSKGYSLPPSQWPTFYNFENKTIQEILSLQIGWRARNKHESINSIDPQYIIDRYHFVKTTYSYLD
tara:strand:- start:306 stop:971 length:666 start_codon:yes stop_codon:yes gene_type:complete